MTVSGGNASRVFQVDPGVTASISGLTITGGQTASNGGGLYNSGHDHADRLHRQRQHRRHGSGTAQGGGIYNSGTLSLTNSTISGNRASGYYFASHGGGICQLRGTADGDRLDDLGQLRPHTLAAAASRTPAARPR